MVKASTYGNRGTRPSDPGTEIDYGMPVTHPAVMIPIIGLILFLIIGLITCFCKLWPEWVPESCRFFGKRSVMDKNLQLQLGRRERSPRRTSESSQVSGRSNRSHQNSSSRPQSFNSKDWAAGRPSYLDQPPSYSPPAPPPPSYGLSPMAMSTSLPPPSPPSYESFKTLQQHQQQHRDVMQV